MKNPQIAEILRRIGTLFEIKGENVFKIKAYYKAADNIDSLGEDIEQVRKEGRLAEIPGVGEALEKKITEWIDTGRMSAYEELIKEVPEGLLKVVEIPSVGPKKAKLFFEKLKVKNVDDLRRVAQEGQLRGLPGIQEKTIENILKGIRVVAQGQERMNLGVATEIADQFLTALKKLPEVKDISLAGSLRRGSETVRDIDILIDSSHPQKVMDYFVHLPQVKSINAYGETKSSILTKDNIQVDLRVIDPKSFGAALLYFTGSKNFNIKLRQVAMKKDMKVNEYGIFLVKDGQEKCLASKTEQECFKALGLPYVPPELREDIGAAELFSNKKIPPLIEQRDIKGELHVHSTWSDGRNSIKEMIQAAMVHGYEYLAISDHSARLKIAGGVSPADLKKKKKEIDELNKGLKNFRILFGSEVEIDMEGNLDYNEAILSDFDVVIAAIHSGFEQSPQQLTQRLVKACQNKHVHVIAHPTAVHIGKREPLNIDLKTVCQAAADHKVCLEINSFPVRLDLNSPNVYYARSQGVKFVINSDAHSTEHLDYIKFGVAIARRGWLRKEDVMNTLSLKDLLKTFKK